MRRQSTQHDVGQLRLRFVISCTANILARNQLDKNTVTTRFPKDPVTSFLRRWWHGHNVVGLRGVEGRSMIGNNPEPSIKAVGRIYLSGVRVQDDNGRSMIDTCTMAVLREKKHEATTCGRQGSTTFCIRRDVSERPSRTSPYSGTGPRCVLCLWSLPRTDLETSVYKIIAFIPTKRLGCCCSPQQVLLCICPCDGSCVR